MELALDGSGNIEEATTAWEFQSLFSWNLLLMRQQIRCCRAWPLVSILVFVELALDDGNVFEQMAKEVATFQSLFSWNLLLMVHFVMPRAVRISFQSLFSWNLLLMRSPTSRATGKNAVSILVFVELALDASWANRTASLSSFNPCFRGTCS